MSVDTLTETLLGEPDENANSSPPNEGDAPETVSFADELKASEDRIMSAMTEGLRANRQSQTATIDNRVTGMQEVLIDELKKVAPEGTDFEALEDKAFIRSQRSTPPEESPAEGSPQAPEASTGSAKDFVKREIDQILQEHGLSGDEPELGEYLRDNRGKRWSQVGTGFEELATTIAARNEGDGASFQANPSGSPPNPNLEAAFRKEVTELRAKGRSYTERMHDYREIEARYQKQGIDTAKVVQGLL